MIMKFFRYIPIVLAVICSLMVSCKKEIPDVVSADVTEFSISGEGESVKVNITANRQWVASTESNWISLPNAQSESGTSQLTIRVKKNETESSREGYVRVDAGDASVTIKVAQRLRMIMDLDMAGAYIDYMGDTLFVQMETNSEYSIEIVEGAEWISQLETKAVIKEELQFVIDKNSEKVTRKGKIIFTELTEGKKKEIMINQYGMPDIVEFTYTGSAVSAPDFVGKAPQAVVDWGDGITEGYYMSSPEHSYEHPGEYVVNVAVRESNGFTIEKMTGISVLDLSNY